jgi:hypothetical protein
MPNATAKVSQTHCQLSGESTPNEGTRPLLRPDVDAGAGSVTGVHDQDGAVDRATRMRAVALGAAVAFAAMVAATAIAFSIIALPLYVAARGESGDGLDRDLIRMGLFVIAVPAGALTGVVCGTLVTVWSLRGGRLEREPPSLYET